MFTRHPYDAKEQIISYVKISYETGKIVEQYCFDATDGTLLQNLSTPGRQKELTLPHLRFASPIHISFIFTKLPLCHPFSFVKCSESAFRGLHSQIIC